MRRNLVGGLAWIVVCLAVTVPASGSIAVRGESESGLELDVKLGAFNEVWGADGTWMGVKAERFTPMFPDSLGIAVPATSVLIAVPEGLNVDCNVSDLTPSKTIEYTEADLSIKLGDVLDDLPKQPARVMVDGYLGNQRVAVLRITPLVYDGDAGVFRLHTGFLVRVGWSRPVPESNGRAAVRRYDAATERSLRNAIVNYDQGLSWRRAWAAKAGQGDYFTDAASWLKVKVDTTGIYRITGADLQAAGVDLGDIVPAGIRMYSGGGLPLKENLLESNPDWMRSVPIKVSGAADGRFDRGDSVIFYGLGVYDWADLYDTSYDRWAFYESFYSTYNCYWLTWGGSFSEQPGRMAAIGLPECDGCDSYQPESFLERVHVEQNALDDFNVHADDGWYWRPLRTDNLATFYADTPFPDSERPATLKVRVADWHTTSECPGSYYRIILRLNDKAVEDTVWRASISTEGVVDVIAGECDVAAANEQKIGIYPASSLPPPYTGRTVCGKLYLAWYEVHYWRQFRSLANSLFFWSPDSTCTARYEIGGFNTRSLYVFDVTDQYAVKELTGFEVAGGPEFTASFYDDVSAGTPKRYAVVARSALLKPLEISAADIANIRYREGASYCVITHDDLVDAARTIAEFRDGEVVTTRQIYDEFAWGQPDVTAIRDFLRWRLHGNQPLFHVLLLGDATWDFKGNLTSATYPDYVPSYERRYLPPTRDAYATDDWLVYLEPATGDSMAYFPTVAVSRLPASSPEEAEMLVSRQIEYTVNPEIGPWQNRVIVVADDDHISTGCEEGSPHTIYAEELSDEALPPVFERVKIYLTEYPLNPSGFKPKARSDFIKQLNNGALLSNFVGHGDPYRLAQEEVFNPSAVDQVMAGRRLSFFIAASCNVSRFDEPTVSSMAEDLLKHVPGGTIGSLASTHFCLAFPNQLLNKAFLKQVFMDGDKYPVAQTASALVIAKAQTVGISIGYRPNSEMFALFGDPALELVAPRLDVRFEPVLPDTLLRQKAYDLSVEVFDGSEVAGWFGGVAETHLREMDDANGHTACDGIFFDYELPGPEIFRGKTPVSGGAADLGFFLPSGIPQGKGSNLRCFVSDGLVSGSGLLDSLVVEGDAPVDDIEGPVITLTSNGQPVEAGDTLVVGQRIDVAMWDESGVAVEGKSEEIATVSFSFDGGDAIGIADSLFSVNGDFRQSDAHFEIPELPLGEHVLTVAAFDNLYTASSADYAVYVGSGPQGVGNVVYAYPNPSRGVCYIIWEYENDKLIEVDVTIYTLAGRRIWTGSTTGIGSYHEVMWDGTDLAGDPVANGTYIAVVKARSPSDPGFSTEEKIVLALMR